MLRSMCRLATKPKGNKEETTADIIWPQKDSARGRSRGKTNWLEAINGRRQEAMEPGTFSIALEWLSNGLMDWKERGLPERKQIITKMADTKSQLFWSNQELMMEKRTVKRVSFGADNWWCVLWFSGITDKKGTKTTTDNALTVCC